MAVRLGLIVCSLTGFLISLYFTLVTYRLMKPDQRFIPPVCRMSGDSCLSIVDSPQARLFGVPNSLLGIAYYLGVLFAAIGGGLPSAVFYSGLLALSICTVLIGMYLIYSLLAVLKVRCVLCFTGHILNLLILLFLLASGSG
ncbi:MAG TPA: vitamin K epoxide reductase family protein [Bacteroidota bacterium]|nr:vitamin K epoxide reductase family protein [Bacteroidota bacterium]